MENVFSIFRGPNGTIFAIIFATLIVLLTIGMYFKFMDSCNLFYYKKKILLLNLYKKSIGVLKVEN